MRNIRTARHTAGTRRQIKGSPSLQNSPSRVDAEKTPIGGVPKCSRGYGAWESGRCGRDLHHDTLSECVGPFVRYTCPKSDIVQRECLNSNGLSTITSTHRLHISLKWSVLQSTPVRHPLHHAERAFRWLPLTQHQISDLRGSQYSRGSKQAALGRKNFPFSSFFLFFASSKHRYIVTSTNVNRVRVIDLAC